MAGFWKEELEGGNDAIILSSQKTFSNEKCCIAVQKQAFFFFIWKQTHFQIYRKHQHPFKNCIRFIYLLFIAYNLKYEPSPNLFQVFLLMGFCCSVRRRGVASLPNLVLWGKAPCWCEWAVSDGQRTEPDFLFPGRPHWCAFPCFYCVGQSYWRGE